MDLRKQLYELEQISKNLIKQIETIKKNIPLSDTDKYNINRTLSVCKNKGWGVLSGKSYDKFLNVPYYEFYKNNHKLGLKLYTGYNLKYNIFPGVLGVSDSYLKNYEIKSDIKNFVESLEWDTINDKSLYKIFNPVNKSLETINIQLVLFDLFYNEFIHKYTLDNNMKSKAIENYCKFHNKNIKDVSSEEVFNSSAGIDGWYNYNPINTTNIQSTFTINANVNLFDIVNNKNKLYSGYYNNYTIDINYKKDDKIEWREKCLLIDNIDNHKKIKVKHNNIIKTLFVKNIKNLKNLKKYDKDEIDDEISMITNKFKDVDFKKRKIK
jgi:hypothetical protein